jgi:2-hydroxy-6-oxonona-2,4-dienedioate hydrolase
MWPKSYAEQIRKAEERLLTFDRKTIDSAFGTIEFAERGTGPPLLVSQGIVGGFDACVVTAEVWVGEGFHVIGPSRFGYFRSAVPEGANPAL